MAEQLMSSATGHECVAARCFLRRAVSSCLHTRVWLFGENADPSASKAARQAWLEGYRRQNAAVREHFVDFGARFLLMDLTKEMAGRSFVHF